jgi:hypothetical protein
MEATLAHESHPSVLVHSIYALECLLTQRLITPIQLLTPHGPAIHALCKLTHASTAVRAASLSFLAAAARLMDVPDLYAFLRPAVCRALNDSAHALELSPMLYAQPSVVRSAGILHP